MPWRVYKGYEAIDEAFWWETYLARPVPAAAAASSRASDNAGADAAVQRGHLLRLSNYKMFCSTRS